MKKVASGDIDPVDILTRSMNSVGGLAFPATIRIVQKKKPGGRPHTEDVQFFGLSAEDMYAIGASIGLILRSHDDGTHEGMLQVATKARAFGRLMVRAKIDSVNLRPARAEADDAGRGH